MENDEKSGQNEEIEQNEDLEVGEEAENISGGARPSNPEAGRQTA